jgi:hypothetical protein
MDKANYTVTGLDIGGSLHIAAILRGDPLIYPTTPYANSASAPWAWVGQAESVPDAVAHARVAFAEWHHGHGPIGSEGVIIGAVPPEHRRTMSTSEQPTVKRRWWDPRRYW